MKRILFFLSSGVMALMIGGAAAAQTGACAAISLAAFETLATRCAAAGSSTACYGAGNVSAGTTASAAFAAPGDLLPLADMTSVTAGAVTTEPAAWGLAQLHVQANHPLVAAELPAHVGLMYLLIGEATLENSVAADAAFQPQPSIPAVSLVPASVRVNPFENSTVVTSIAAGQAFVVDAISPDSAWLRGIAPDGLVGWVSANVVAAETAGLPVVTPETRTPMQSFILRTSEANAACAGESVPAPMLLIQSPQTLTALIEVNGEVILIRSTIALRVLPGNILQVIALSGTARAGSVVVPAGFVLSLQLNEAGDAAAEGALWRELRPVNAEERDMLTALETLAAPVLPYYPFQLPSESEIQAVLDAAGGATYGTSQSDNAADNPGGGADILQSGDGVPQPVSEGQEPGGTGGTNATPGATPGFQPTAIARPTATRRPCFTRDGRQC